MLVVYVYEKRKKEGKDEREKTVITFSSPYRSCLVFTFTAFNPKDTAKVLNICLKSKEKTHSKRD